MLAANVKTSVALVALILTNAGLLVSQSLADPPSGKDAARPKSGEASLTEAEFQQLKPVLDLKNQLWTTIPWKYSITEARKLAAQTRKPIFLNVNTGNCLGSV
jgi:hypothetical protein